MDGREDLRPAVRLAVCASAADAGEAETQTVSLTSLSETAPVSVASSPAEVASALPSAPGVYAIYDATGQLQYIGLSRKVYGHVQLLFCSVRREHRGFSCTEALRSPPAQV